MCFGRRNPDLLPVGASVQEAEKILERRLEKLRVVHAHGDAGRAADKAVGVLRLCCTWDAPEPAGVAALRLISSMNRATWVLCVLGRADYFPWLIEDVLPAQLKLCERVYGERSLDAAEILYDMAQLASSIEDDFATVRWGRTASKLLLKLRGADFYVPPAEALARVESATWETWETAESRLPFCAGSHIACLGLLVTAHGRLTGQQRLAMAAAKRHLALLDKRFGRGHLLTVPGAFSMMDATFRVCAFNWLCFAASSHHAHSLPPPPPSPFPKGDSNVADVRQSMKWANYAISIFQREHGGCASIEEAGAWEHLAWLLLNTGPAHNVESAARLAAHAAAMRAACKCGPNEELDETVALIRSQHAEGVVDRFGAPAVGVAAAAETARAAGGGYGACDTGDGIGAEEVEVAAEVGATVFDHFVGVANFVVEVLGSLSGGE